MNVARYGLSAAAGVSTLLTGLAGLVAGYYWLTWLLVTPTPWQLSGAFLWSIILAALVVQTFVLRKISTGGE